MPRLPNSSGFVAPVMREEPRPAVADDGTFERQLMGWCLTSLVDQSPPAQSRTWWADRLKLSKSHLTKMLDLPSVAFIDTFDFALAEDRATSIDVEGRPRRVRDEGAGRPLNALPNDFYAELRPEDRRYQNDLMLEWAARYRPKISQEVELALYRSEVALHRVPMLKRKGSSGTDERVQESVRSLLRVVGGPFGGSMIAYHQLVKFAMAMPGPFFEAVDEFMDTSPVGFRMLRGVELFLRHWIGQGIDSDQARAEEIPRSLTRLAGRIADGLAEGVGVDPYPGQEWAIAFARVCFRVPDAPRELAEHARRILQTIAGDEHLADRARVYAAWLLASHAEAGELGGPETKSEAVASLAASTSDYLQRWAKILSAPATQADPMLDVPRAYPDDARPTIQRDAALTEHVLAEFDSVARRVEELLGRELDQNDPRYKGIVNGLSSITVAALLTPDGRMRRIYIEAIVHSGLSAPTASVLQQLFLEATEDQNAGKVPEAVCETAIFLLGRLRNGTSGTLEELTEFVKHSKNFGEPVIHAAVWSFGDLSRAGVEFAADEGLDELAAWARGERGGRPMTRISAAHALAIIAYHQSRTEGQPSSAKERLAAIAAELEGVSEEGAQVATALCRWGMGISAGVYPPLKTTGGPEFESTGLLADVLGQRTVSLVPVT